ncbi:patatin-like phospholipase family protein [Alkalibacter mobilis]|uniref:patatin-like phospholipase family protein n=1 Tax=Alkalibacter mobilis TaxID=2787712 RepID=UPI00189D21B7|nr:patatin-like phospholipase family protein [Alkalibacter mobilis]MBF7096944.1 hypothetical protein [Alkalibacter mobilis]
MSYGLILGGDGSKSAFELGVWKGLMEINVEICAVTGSSIGLVNAALIAQNDFELAISFWSEGFMSEYNRYNQILTENYLALWSKLEDHEFRSAFKTFIYSEIPEIKAFKDYLAKYLNEDKIRGSSVNLILQTYSPKDIKPAGISIDQIPEGDLMDHILSGFSYPALRIGTDISETPGSLLTEFGYLKHILAGQSADHGFPYGNKPRPIESVSIQNSEHLGLTLEFDPVMFERNVAMGHLDTLKKFDVLQGKYYYLDLTEGMSDFTKFKEHLGFPLPGEDGIKLPSLLGIKNFGTREENISSISGLLGFTPYRGRPMAISMIEMTARNLNVPRLKKYTCDELIGEIFQSVNSLLDKHLASIKSPEKILSIFKLNDEEGTPLDEISFLSYYMYFLSIGVNSRFPLKKLTENFTPEISLSIITLLYLSNG